MLVQLKSIDTSFFLAINGAHSQFFDFLMYWISVKWVWIPLYVFFAWLLYRKFGNRFWILVLVAGAAIAISDQTVTLLFKDVFQRLRPCHEPSLAGIVHIVNDHCGGNYSFISSHASNSFALVTYLSLLLGKKIKYFTILLILWALLICYSRVYLGVHYPGDVIVGGLWGAGIGAASFILFNHIDTISHNRKAHRSTV